MPKMECGNNWNSGIRCLPICLHGLKNSLTEVLKASKANSQSGASFFDPIQCKNWSFNRQTSKNRIAWDKSHSFSSFCLVFKYLGTGFFAEQLYNF